MRPLRLQLENFTCFRGPQPVLDLERLELFAIAGPTGSGKSSLLDAMLFALYGTVPRLPRAKSAADLIALGRDRLAVVFDFSVGGAAYRVARSVRRRATVASDAQLERLPEDADAEPEPVADGVTAVGTELQRLLGLSYDAFAQAVVLPQGEFARFLRSSPRDRQRILRDLLRLSVFERMRQRADTEARLAEAAVKGGEDVLGSTLADATPEALKGLEARLAESRRRLEGLPEEIKALEVRVEGLRAEAARARELAQARQALERLVAREPEVESAAARLATARSAERVLPLAISLEEAQKRARQAAQAAAAARTEAARAVKVHATATAALAEAERGAEALPGIATRLEQLARAEALVAPLRSAERGVADAEARVRARRGDVAAAEDAIEASQAAAEKASRAQADGEKQAARAAKAHAAASAALAKAREALREAERLHAVAHLRRGLKKGDDCPVCARPLARKPGAVRGADLAVPEASLAKAEEHDAATRTEEESTREAAQGARREAERARLELQGRRERLEAARALLVESEGDRDTARERRNALAAELRALESDDDPAAQVRELRARQRALSEALESARRAAAAEGTALASAQARDASAREAADEAETRYAAEAERAGAAAREAGFDDLDAARAAALPAERQSDLETEVLEHRRARHALEERVRSLGSGSDDAEAFDEARLTAEEDSLAALREERDAAVRAEATLEAQCEGLRRRLDEADARRRELAAARARHATLRQLALDLQAGAFQAWLLEETFAELVEGASDRLLELSGRYGLAHEDKAFYVVDRDNAGERRRAETLSGGETFLASLALALELSQQVQRAAGAVPLESLFIDEGFGTLDPETLEAVTGAIESLPRAGRVVGVVTHLKELTDRMPARIRVSRGPAGSTAVVEDR